MEIDLDSMFAQYPKPTTNLAGHGMSDSFCVMGIFCDYLRKMVPDEVVNLDGAGVEISHFPRPSVCGKFLTVVNPKLTGQAAENAALKITTANDDGNFDTAKELLRLALSPTTTPEQPKKQPKIASVPGKRRKAPKGIDQLPEPL